MIDASVLQKLTTFDTPTICNIVELFNVRPRNQGFMDDRIKAAFPEMGPIVGFAATASFRSDAPAGGEDGYGSMEEQINLFETLSGPPIVVFQDLDDPVVAATFGEVMCTTYQTFGAAGLITSGAGRDLDQVRDIGFPVFTSGTICAHGYCHFPQLNIPVRVGGITVNPDDMLHCDVNGITTVPAEIASEIADIGDEFVAAEGIVLDALRGPEPSLAKYSQARKEMAAVVADLQGRVTRA